MERERKAVERSSRSFLVENMKEVKGSKFNSLKVDVMTNFEL